MIVIRLSGLVPQKRLKEQDNGSEKPPAPTKLKINIDDDPFPDDEEMNELAFSSDSAASDVQKDIKVWSALLGKISQKVISGMLDGVKNRKYDAMDISLALKHERPSTTHGYEAQFMQDLWTKIREKFRKYIPGGKLRR
jgi:hypothetical protein